MSRYIDVDKLGIGRADPKIFNNPEYANGWNSAIEIIEKAPTADVVEVVRCEKCKYYVCKNGRDMCKRNAVYNEYSQDYMGLVAIGGRTHFCGYGAKMDGGVKE